MIAAAICPHPPVLLPEAAGAAAGELDDLRAACDAAVVGLLRAGPDAVLVVGGSARTAAYGPAATGSFRPYGVDRLVRLGHGNQPDDPRCHDPWRHDSRRHDPSGGGQPDHGELPLSLAVGAWLLARAGADVPRLGRAVATDSSADDCARLGAALHAGDPRRLALLVMGDGSACRGVKAPGYDDPRAAPYDDGVATALTGADPDALLGLDPVVSAELKVAGRASWQVLAGAVRAAGGAWRGRLGYYAAPYGVAYFAATWAPA